MTINFNPLKKKKNRIKNTKYIIKVITISNYNIYLGRKCFKLYHCNK